jgi:hypothetical protein
MYTTLIYTKMSNVMKEIKSVSKNEKNQAQGYKFRGIDAFINALYPALTKHGVFMTPRCTSYTQELKDVTRGSGKPGVDKHVSMLMEYDFFAEDGSKVTVGPIPAEGLDSGDKATNKALSAALKYALIQTFSVPTEDMAEADLETPEIGVTTTSVTPTTLKSVSATTATTVAGTTSTPKHPASFARKAKETTPVATIDSSTVMVTADDWES